MCKDGGVENRIKEVFGSQPEFRYFESPVVINNVNICRERIGPDPRISIQARGA
jgi:hypothetical protein